VVGENCGRPRTPSQPPLRFRRDADHYWGLEDVFRWAGRYAEQHDGEPPRAWDMLMWSAVIPREDGEFQEEWWRRIAGARRLLLAEWRRLRQAWQAREEAERAEEEAARPTGGVLHLPVALREYPAKGLLLYNRVSSYHQAGKGS
jgi:hypothetical protein